MRAPPWASSAGAPALALALALPAAAWANQRKGAGEAVKAMKSSSERLAASVLEIITLVQYGLVVAALATVMAYIFALYAGRADGGRLVSIIGCLLLALLSASVAQHLLLPDGKDLDSLAGGEAPWGEGR